MIFSTLSFTILNIMVKWMQHLPTLEIVFFRAIGSCILCLLFLKRNNIPVLGNQRMLLLSRGIVGVMAMSTFFWAVQIIPFGSAISLRYLAPVFAAILAVLFLKEKVRPIQWLFFGLAFSGVVLLKGFDLRIGALGLGVITTSALLTGCVYIIIRKIGESEHPVVIVNYFMFIATVVGLIGAIPNWYMPQGKEWAILISMGFFGFIGQLFMTKAFQVEQASRIGPVKYMEVVFALLAGWLVFGETYSWIAFLGILMIISGMFLNVIIKESK